jgi:hypothetical protein
MPVKHILTLNPNRFTTADFAANNIACSFLLADSVDGHRAEETLD